MYDLDFEQVRGFEPPVMSPYRPLDAKIERNLDDLDLTISTQIFKLSETSFDSSPATVKEASDEPAVIPYKSKPRQFVRWPISENGVDAEFHILGRTFTSRLVEFSIGGFGIIVPKQLSVHPGTLGRLRASGLYYIVKVTRVESRDEGSFVGLKQVEEIVDNSRYGPIKNSPAVTYAIAGIAATLIAGLSYYFMMGR